MPTAGPYLIEPKPPTCLFVEGSPLQFPIHRVYCVGRNYLDHAIEMGFSDREPPFFFMKPADAVVPVAAGVMGEFPYPVQSKNVHHEGELVVALRSGGRHLTVEDAIKHVAGWAIGLDMTCRDLQFTLRDQGRPWEPAKAFENSAPVGPLHLIERTNLSAQATIKLQVNGHTRQSSTINHLIWNVAEIISTLSEFFELQPGDLIFTGTPAGVGPVVSGDQIDASIEGLGTLTVRVV